VEDDFNHSNEAFLLIPNSLTHSQNPEYRHMNYSSRSALSADLLGISMLPEGLQKIPG
jgi:hypothetical protein